MSFPTKARRVAIGRAIARMKHGTWTVGIFERKGHLYDPCNLDSVRKAHHPMTDKVNFEPRGFIYEGVQRAIRFRDGSPLERIQVQIEDAQRRCGFERQAYGRMSPEAMASVT